MASVKGDKRIGYLTPDNPPENALMRVFCIPNDPTWLGVFMGAILPLTQPESWVKFGSQTPEQSAAAFAQIIENAYDEIGGCLEMNCCEMRYSDTGQVQQLNPETGEWEDIGQAPIPPIPPIVGENTKCLAAANATYVFLNLWNETRRLFQLGVAPLVILSAIISLLATLIFFPQALPLVLSFFTELYGLLSELVDDEFTGDEQDEFRCLLFCNSAIEDGIVTFDYDVILAEVQSKWSVADANVWAGIYYLMLIVQEDGLNRSGAIGAITDADCNDCGCGWCHISYFSISQDGWTPVVFASNDAAYSSGTGWGRGTANNCEIGIKFDFGASVVQGVEIGLLNGASGANPRFALNNAATGLIDNGTGLFAGFGVTVTGEISVFYSTDWAGTCSGAPNSDYIVTVKSWGTGENPWGEEGENCP